MMKKKKQQPTWMNERARKNGNARAPRARYKTKKKQTQESLYYLALPLTPPTNARYLVVIAWIDIDTKNTELFFNCSSSSAVRCYGLCNTYTPGTVHQSSILESIPGYAQVKRSPGIYYPAVGDTRRVLVLHIPSTY